MTSPWNNELDYNEYITLANNSFCVPTAYRTITMKKPFKSYTFLEAGEPYQVAVSIRESLNLYSRQNLKNFHIFKSILSDQSLVKGLRRALNFSEEEIYSYHQSVTTVSTTYGITTQDTEVTTYSPDTDLLFNHPTTPAAYFSSNLSKNEYLNFSCQNVSFCGQPICLGSECRSIKAILPLIFIFVMMLMIIIGNLLVVNIIFISATSGAGSSSRAASNHRYNALKVSLAVSDIFIGVFVLPIFFWNISKMSSYSNREELVRKLYREQNTPLSLICSILTLLCISASEYTLMLMAFDRFLAINAPIFYSKNKQITWKLILLIISMWLLILAMILYPVFQDSENFSAFPDPLIGVYFPQFSRDSIYYKTYYFYLLIFFPYIGMLGFTIVSTFQIRYKLKKMRTNEDYRLMRITLVMVVMYSFCMLPIIMTVIKKQFFLDVGFDCQGVSKWYFISVHFLFINSAVNFVVYSLMSKRFCSALVKKYPAVVSILPRKVISRGFSMSRVSESGQTNAINKYSIKGAALGASDIVNGSKSTALSRANSLWNTGFRGLLRSQSNANQLTGGNSIDTHGDGSNANLHEPIKSNTMTDGQAKFIYNETERQKLLLAYNNSFVNKDKDLLNDDKITLSERLRSLSMNQLFNFPAKFTKHPSIDENETIVDSRDKRLGTRNISSDKTVKDRCEGFKLSRNMSDGKQCRSNKHCHNLAKVFADINSVNDSASSTGYDSPNKKRSGSRLGLNIFSTSNTACSINNSRRGSVNHYLNTQQKKHQNILNPSALLDLPCSNNNSRKSSCCRSHQGHSPRRNSSENTCTIAQVPQGVESNRCIPKVVVSKTTSNMSENSLHISLSESDLINCGRDNVISPVLRIFIYQLLDQPDFESIS